MFLTPIYNYFQQHALNNIISHTNNAIFKILMIYKNNNNDFFGHAGMGFLISSNLLVTNYHVMQVLYDSNVTCTDSTIVDKDGKEHEGDIEYVNRDHDIVFIKMKKSYDVYISLNQSRWRQIFNIITFNKKVFAIMYKIDIDYVFVCQTEERMNNLKPKITIFHGKTNKLRSVRSIDDYSKLIHKKMMLVSDIKTYAGMSGTPLIDYTGKLVGMITSAGKNNTQGSALPTNKLIELLKDYDATIEK